MNDKHETADHSAPVKKKRSIFTYLKYLLGLIPLLVLGLVLMIVLRFLNDAKIPYEVSTEGVAIPKFAEVEIDFAHNYVSIFVFGPTLI